MNGVQNFAEDVVAGDTLDFPVSVPDFPSTDGWTLKYRLTPRFTSPVMAPVVLTALANADGSYQVQASPAATALWAAGFYTWARWVEKAGARQTLDESGQLQVKPDPAATVQGFDSRSHPRKVLDAIVAVLEARATRTQRELVGQTIGIRSQQFDAAETKEKLLEFKSRYQWLVQNEVDREKIAAGHPNPRDIRIRFTRP